MSCHCQPNSDLPQLIGSTPCACACLPEVSDSVASEGTVLAASWRDAVCVSGGVTLLGRFGTNLAKLAGSGFIKLENGIASVVESVPLRTTALWHRFVRSATTSPPAIGEPLPFPYQVIADGVGNHHLIRGTGQTKSVTVWDNTSQNFVQTPVSDIPDQTKGPLPRANGIELTGYAPIAENGPVDTVRSVRALNGAGLVVLTEQATVDGDCECAPGVGTASVASTLALPVPLSNETYTLKYSTALGLHWSAD